jgi:hypothetical protein
MCLLRSRVRSPSSAGRASLPGTSRAMRRWRNQRISLTSGEERESRGEALTAVYLSHRVSAGPITARTRFRARELGEGFDSYVDIHHHQASRQCGRVLSPRQRRRPCGTASPSAIAAATRRSNQHGERLDEEDRQEGSSKEVQC